jgi:hypothetical protein
MTKNALEQAAKKVDELRNALEAYAQSGSTFDEVKHEELVREFGDATEVYIELIQRLVSRHANG